MAHLHRRRNTTAMAPRWTGAVLYRRGSDADGGASEDQRELRARFAPSAVPFPWSSGSQPTRLRLPTLRGWQAISGERRGRRRGRFGAATHGVAELAGRAEEVASSFAYGWPLFLSDPPRREPGVVDPV